MFSSAFISFVLGASVGGWVYMKALKQTGGNAKSAITVAAVVGGVTFLVAITLTGMLIKS